MYVAQHTHGAAGANVTYFGNVGRHAIRSLAKGFDIL